MSQKSRAGTIIIGTLSLMISAIYCLTFLIVLTELSAEDNSSRFKNVVIGLVGSLLFLLSSIFLLIGVAVGKSLLLIPWIISFPILLVVWVGKSNVWEKIIYAEHFEQMFCFLAFYIGMLVICIFSIKTVVKHLRELFKDSKEANDAHEIGANSLALSPLVGTSTNKVEKAEV